MRFGEAERLRVSFGREAVYVRTAGVGEAEHFGALVEGFARGIVDGLPDYLHVERGTHEHYLRVTARNQEAEEGELRHFGSGVGLDKMGEDVAVEMVDVHGGNPERDGEPFGEADPHM